MTVHTLQLDRPLTGAVLLSRLDNRTEAGEPADSTKSRESELQGEEIEELLEQIASNVKKIQARHADNLVQLKTTSVQLAMLVINKLVGSSDLIQTRRLEQLLDDALNRTEPAVGIHVHPSDISKVEAYAKKNSTDLQQLEMVGDESVDAGECRVNFATYHLESSLSQQINEIGHRLLEVVNDQ